MTHRRDLTKLAQLSAMILDQRLASLHEAAAQRARSLAQLDDLIPKPSEGLGLIASGQAEMRYNRWADARRAEINLNLARQTVVWMEARAEAAQAFSRADVLKKLQSQASRGSDKS